MSLKESVDSLYVFKDTYFETHPPEDASKKLDDLSNELQKTLVLFDKEKDTLDSDKKPEYELLKAKAFNVLPDSHPEAEEILTKLVKFHPKLVEAWNELGVYFWKKGDIKAAKSCFENAMQQKKNPKSYRCLSMILRQMGNTPEEKLSRVKESMEKAKEAVNLDTQDGESWYVLGNAYQTLFYASSYNLDLLKQALSAYSQAALDKSTRYSPDLYYNWAIALKYDENYRLALENLEKAIKYDPTWVYPKEQLDSLLKHLENIQTLIAKKGKLKPKKTRELLKCAKDDFEVHGNLVLNKNDKGETQTFHRGSLAKLAVGSNPDKVVTGKVVCHVYLADNPAFTFCLLDADDTCFAVTVYNITRDKGIIIGDTIDIFSPVFQHFNFSYKDKTFSFPSVRVNSPLQLRINKKRLGKEMISVPSFNTVIKND